MVIEGEFTFQEEKSSKLMEIFQNDKWKKMR